eukprot:CAMPEP_0119045776 /NCGR_PEP_ID=MMETSP1177-20130426/42569_1 /TAXON_ID=2985 /ORGANISM="Ochromonas sp, Strain CCMP1899" /LENGTH=775 /DNA_ID=CAMNT_0007018129 /DNA_START=150 /DNA_END=2477 /DNA_ORIENTATION=-
MTNEAAATNKSVIVECERLRKNIQSVSDKNYGPLEKSDIKSTLFPFVLLLGNHSSGKSSFVNYIMDRKIQTAGVAPTDDNFTIISPGDVDIDRDGASCVGDPDLGFQGLKHFGPVLVHRTQLKIRTGTQVKGFCVVDSPGMIDSPVVKDHFGSGRHSVMDRGYDFEGVCRWYAERADVILLFFDPDKPGTTGETLSILTNSLKGLDHKLHLILNKADQFRKIHDFARAYGSLCWNLSKVIPRKDLPQIFTMCLPIGSAGSTSGPNSTVVGSGDGSTVNDILLLTESYFLRQGYADLEESRLEVTREVFNAPKRRVDHEISRLSDSVYMLLMHCKVIDSTVSRYRARLWTYRLGLLAASCTMIITTVVVGVLLADGEIKKQKLLVSPSSTSFTPPGTEADPSTVISSISDEKKTSFFSSFFKSKEIPVTQPSSSPLSISTDVGNVIPTTTDVVNTLVHDDNAISPWVNDYSFLRSYSLLKGVLGTALTGVTSLMGLQLWQNNSLNNLASSLVTEEGFNDTYSKIYAKPIAKNDEFTKDLWHRVHSKLRMSVSYTELSLMKRVGGPDVLALERILEEDVANLRRQASPTFPNSSNRSARSLPHRTSLSSNTPLRQVPSIAPMVTSTIQEEAVSSSSRIIASSNSDSSPIEDQGHVSPPILITEEKSLIPHSHTNGDSTSKSEEIDRSLNELVKKTDESVVQTSVSDSLPTAKINKKKQAKIDISTVNVSVSQDITKVVNSNPNDSTKVIKASNGVDSIESSTISHKETSPIEDITSV